MTRDAFLDLHANGETFTTGLQGSQIAWRAWGQGTPVVLIHGAFGSWSHWARNITALAARHRVLVPDLPGYGKSDISPDNSISAFTDRIMAGLAEIVPDHEPLRIIGFSFGCYVACKLADALQDRLARLILIGSAGIVKANTVEGLLPSRSNNMTLAEARATAAHNLATIMLSEPPHPADVSIDIQLYNTSHTRHSISRTLLDASQRETLRAQARHTTLIWGKQDVLTLGLLDNIAQQVKAEHTGATLYFIDHAGHWAQFEQYKQVNTLLLDQFN